MAGRVAQGPQSKAVTTPLDVTDPTIKRAFDAVRAAIEELQAMRSRAVVIADLAVGTNKVRHGLGRALAGYTLTPTVADASFAHCLNRNNPRPELEAWIEVVGVAQPKAVLEVF